MASQPAQMGRKCFIDTIAKPPFALMSKPSLLSKESISRLSSLDTFLESKETEWKGSVSGASSQRSVNTTASVKGWQEDEPGPRRRFRSTTAEVGFCLSMAVTQLLAVCPCPASSLLMLIYHRSISSPASQPSFRPSQSSSLRTAQRQTSGQPPSSL